MPLPPTSLGKKPTCLLETGQSTNLCPAIHITKMRLLVLLAVSLLPLTSAMSGGAPEGACQAFKPQHAGTEPQDLATAEFDLRFKHVPRGGKVLAKAGSKGLELQLRPGKAFKDEEFRGFLIQARYAENDAPAGVFDLQDRTKYVECDDAAPQSTITHTDSDPKKGWKLVWNPAPEDQPNTNYYFVYTIVKDYGTYWHDRKSSLFSLQ